MENEHELNSLKARIMWIPAVLFVTFDLLYLQIRRMQNKWRNIVNADASTQGKEFACSCGGFLQVLWLPLTGQFCETIFCMCVNVSMIGCLALRVCFVID